MTIASVDLSGVDFTGYAVFFAVILTLIAGSFAIPGVRVARAAGRSATPLRRTGRFVGAALLICAALAPAYGAARLVWAAHRGDYAPYAQARAEARPGCVQAAKDRGLRGSERSADVKRCIRAAVDDE